MNIKIWIEAARLRTLPLAFASIIAGTACAIHAHSFSWVIFVLALLTTLLLQVLSNFANDYGDALSGKDDAGRIGPKRAVSSGEISASSMKKALILFSFLSLLSGIALLFFAFESYLYILLFLILGLGAIAAAIKYTVGKNPYGYMGLGDLFVFLFFGWIGVGGTYFLFCSSFDPNVFWIASSFGFLSVAVLNLNNMRDIENDAKTGKRTLAVKLGLQRAKQYHYLLIVFAFLFLISFALLKQFELKQYLFLLLAPFFAQMLKALIRINQPLEFDPFLKKTALGTFLLSILFLIANLM
ncbi:MAG: 1,4-dihydroxy-2-naphthoate polyprenyltransferase [Bacteroidetes bacterium]|nr:1,4-dihydroxy-2-naphthoate polyprenyltransferase [Bacteroidota bacterium]